MRYERQLFVEGVNVPATMASRAPWRLPHARPCRCGTCALILVDVQRVVGHLALLCRLCPGVPAPVDPNAPRGARGAS